MTGNPKPKVLLILERSEDPTVQVGIVKDCHGSMPIDTSTCDVVGTWNRFDEGTFYVELTTPVEALQDVLIQLITERMKSGVMATYPIIHRSDVPVKFLSRPRPAQPMHETAPIDFGNLRSRLGK